MIYIIKHINHQTLKMATEFTTGTLFKFVNYKIFYFLILINIYIMHSVQIVRVFYNLNK